MCRVVDDAHRAENDVAILAEEAGVLGRVLRARAKLLQRVSQLTPGVEGDEVLGEFVHFPRAFLEAHAALESGLASRPPLDAPLAKCVPTRQVQGDVVLVVE